MTEHELMNAVRMRLTELGFKAFRCNVGKVRTPDGRFFDTGLPKGFSDVFAVGKDGKAYFFEIKVKPNKPTKEQINFITQMKKQGCTAEVIYSLSELEEKLSQLSRLNDV